MKNRAEKGKRSGGVKKTAPKDFLYVCEDTETLFVRDVYGTMRLATDKDWEILDRNREKLVCTEQALPSGGVIVICSEE